MFVISWEWGVSLLIWLLNKEAQRYRNHNFCERVCACVLIERECLLRYDGKVAFTLLIYDEAERT